MNSPPSCLELIAYGGTHRAAEYPSLKHALERVPQTRSLPQRGPRLELMGICLDCIRRLEYGKLSQQVMLASFDN